jgi:hypothetical protein
MIWGTRWPKMDIGWCAISPSRIRPLFPNMRSLRRPRWKPWEAAKIHEAGVDQSVVIVEFENLEKAIAAYESELYRPALEVLDKAAQRDFRIVEGR